MQLLPGPPGRFVTCGLDGKVCLAEVNMESGHPAGPGRAIGHHQSSAHGLAPRPGSDHEFLTAGLDGVVRHFDLRQEAAGAAAAHHGAAVHREPRPGVGLNALAFDPADTSGHRFATVGDRGSIGFHDLRHAFDAAGRGTLDRAFARADFPPLHATGLCFSRRGDALAVAYADALHVFARDDLREGLRAGDAAPGPLPGGEAPAVRGAPSVGFRPPGWANRRTYKGVAFFGGEDDFVAAGSDNGFVYLVDRASGELVNALEADREIANVVAPHPREFYTLATSGIDCSVKVWGPTAAEGSAAFDAEAFARSDAVLMEAYANEVDYLDDSSEEDGEEEEEAAWGLFASGSESDEASPSGPSDG